MNSKIGNDGRSEDTFRVDLSAEEMNFLLSFLPPGYSFQVEAKPKRKEIRAQSTQKKKNTKEIEVVVK